MINLVYCPVCSLPIYPRSNFIGDSWCSCGVVDPQGIYAWYHQLVFEQDIATKLRAAFDKKAGENPVSPCEYCGGPSTRIVTPFGSMEVRACDKCGE